MRTLAPEGTEHESESKTLDVAAIENPELVSGVEDRLANLREITKDPVKQTADDQEELDDSTPEDKEEIDGDKDDEQAEDQDDSDKSTPADEIGSEDADKDEKTLPDAFLRAAIHRGWKEDDAKKYFEDNPDAATTTFQNCLIDVNNASREWAQLGKAKIAAQAKPEEPAPAPVETLKFKGVDIDDLARKYDLDDNAVAILKNQNEQFEQIMAGAAPPAIQAAVPTTVPVQPGPDPNVELQLENFFGSEIMKPFGEFYGAVKVGQNWQDLGAGQRDNRWRTLEQADYLMAGAEMAGRPMDATEALERAHLMVSEPVREQVIREQIKSTATKRQKSMTLKPSDNKRTADQIAAADGEKKPRTKEELQENVQDKLDHLFK